VDHRNGAPVIDAASVSSNLDRVRQRIAAAGGDPHEVAVVAVTKGHPLAAVRAALAVGLTSLGENYAQELLGKAEAVIADPAPDLGAPSWHFVGRLQRNKVRQLAPHVTLWQSVDRRPLAQEIARRAPGAAVLVQVNVSGEPQKGGCPPEATAELVDDCRSQGLDVRGLMTVAAEGDQVAARSGFAALSRLADDLGLRERSMGMSADLEEAVAEGSTMVRVGTDLFGPRAGVPGMRD
jgi:PLP dependent protein